MTGMGHAACDPASGGVRLWNDALVEDPGAPSVTDATAQGRVGPATAARAAESPWSVPFHSAKRVANNVSGVAHAHNDLGDSSSAILSARECLWGIGTDPDPNCSTTV
jgi:hypothetical protein